MNLCKHAKQGEQENCQSKNESKNQRAQNLKNKESKYSNTIVNIIFYVTYQSFCSENWTWAWQSIQRFTTVLIKSTA